jgi:lysophospholipase L1-like esterase
MAGSGISRSASQGEPDVVVTVVRGHTQEASQVFKLGEESGRLSVGSRADWMVSGPGVMPVHLWLSFDGQQLFAASGEGTASLQGRALSEGWTAVPVGAELRFGFALLRVSREATRASAKRKPSRKSSLPIAVLAIGAGVLVLLVVGFVAVKLGGSSQAPRAEPLASAAASAAERAPAVTSPTAAKNEPREAAAALLPPVADDVAPSLPATPTPSPVPLADAPDAQSPTLKPPAAYPQNIANRPVPRIGDKPWLISEEWRAHHERQLRSPARLTAKVIFLGDSITEAWGFAPAYKEAFGKYAPFNLGLAGDTTQNVLWRIEHGALDDAHPQVVVLLIGINNLAGGFTAEQTSDGVRAIVAAVQAHLPSTRILLLGVLPARAEPTNALRQSIKDTNRLLQGLAKPGRVELHDVGSVLLESDGSITKLTMRDFVHPTPEAFERLSQAVAPFLDAMLAPAN